MGKEECIQNFGEKFRRNDTFMSTRRRCEKNIGDKMNITVTGWGHMDWHLAQDRDQWSALINMVMNLRVPQNVGKFLNS
jgi:hypothetical protein